ncbi:MAG: hypothetical protein U0Q03_08175 [Acidimicrobiales bacterium]
MLRRQSPIQGDDVACPARRYTDPEYHRLEVEKLWKKVWADGLPRGGRVLEVGDHVNYEIAGIDVMVVRSAPDNYPGVPQHLPPSWSLKEYDGRDSELRCAFHGIAWNLDGTLKHVPCKWTSAGGRAMVAARGEGRPLGRLRVHQPRSRIGAARGPPRR